VSVCRARRFEVVFSVPSGRRASANRSLTAAPAGPLDLDPAPAREVLAEVEDAQAGRGLADLPDPQRLDRADRRGGVGGQAARRRLAQPRRGPAVVVEARRVPAGLFQACVVGLAVIDLRQHDRRRGQTPALAVGLDPGTRSVRVLDVEQGREPARRRAEGVAHVQEAERTGEPAVADDRAQHVVAGPQQVADVVGPVERSGAKVGRFRGQHPIADLVTIQSRLVAAQGRGVKTGAGHGLVQPESAPQLDRRSGDPGMAGRNDPRRNGLGPGGVVIGLRLPAVGGFQAGAPIGLGVDANLAAVGQRQAQHGRQGAADHRPRLVEAQADLGRQDMGARRQVGQNEAGSLAPGRPVARLDQRHAVQPQARQAVLGRHRDARGL
jgi:hypothetical protein